jgi:hypothetical protein
MPETGYEPFQALDPFFEVVMGGLRGIVDGKHYFDTFAEDAIWLPSRGTARPSGFTPAMRLLCIALRIVAS